MCMSGRRGKEAPKFAGQARLGDEGWPVGGKPRITDCQLVFFHRRETEHVRVFSSIGFIKGLDVDGEFLHKRAGEPAGRRASSGSG